jgi:hypothetical protein
MLEPAGKDVLFTVAETETILQDRFATKLMEKGEETSTIVLVSDPTTIIALSYQIAQGFEGHGITHVIDVDLELPTADTQVALCELVGDVPSQRAVLSSFLNQCVEEAETEEQPLEGTTV